MSESLKSELVELDQRIEQKTAELKNLKKARRKLAGALEQLKLL
jgi:hypothetical protein